MKGEAHFHNTKEMLAHLEYAESELQTVYLQPSSPSELALRSVCSTLIGAIRFIAETQQPTSEGDAEVKG